MGTYRVLNQLAAFCWLSLKVPQYIQNTQKKFPIIFLSAQVGSSVLCTPKNRCFLRMKSLNKKDSSFLKFQNIQCGDKSFIGDKRISWNGKEAVLYFCSFTLFLQPIKLQFIAMNPFVEHKNYIWRHVYIIIHTQ